MRRVLLIDTETSGLDPVVDSVLEVGAILYDLQYATPIEFYAELLMSQDNAAEAINRIPVGALQCASPASLVWQRVMGMAEVADAVLAHNAAFDRGFVPMELRDAAPWICTKEDVRWPKQTKDSPSLVALALEHDLGVAVAHRALADCDLIARLLTRAHELGADLPAMLARGLRPKATFQALVSFDDREKAKAAGFRWEPSTKRWLRTMAVEDAAALPFTAKQVAA